MPLSEIKSYVVVLSFYIKMIKRRTLQVSSLKHSIKKDMLFSLGQIEIILVRHGGFLPSSPPPPWLRTCKITVRILDIMVLYFLWYVSIPSFIPILLLVPVLLDVLNMRDLTRNLEAEKTSVRVLTISRDWLSKKSNISEA